MDQTQRPSVGGVPATSALAGAGKAAAKPAVKPEVEPSPPLSRLQLRRRFVWTAVGAFLVTNFLMFLRFFFPRTLFEPSSRFRIGFPSDFGLGVDERFKQSHRIWVVRHAGQAVRHLRQVHAPGMHAELDRDREQVQVPVPRQRVRHGRAETSRVRRRVRWTAPTWSWTPKARSSWIPAGLYQCPPGGKCEFEEDPSSYLTIS